MSGMFDDILKGLDDLAEFKKTANDVNGAPQNPASQTGGQDIAQVANEFLQNVETFKQQVAQQMGSGIQDPNAVQDPNAQDPNAQAQDPSAGNGVTIQRPDGSIIKVGSILKLAAIMGKDLFKEVE